MKLTDLELGKIRTRSILKVAGKVKFDPKFWFLYFEFDTDQPKL